MESCRQEGFVYYYHYKLDLEVGNNDDMQETIPSILFILNSCFVGGEHHQLFFMEPFERPMLPPFFSVCVVCCTLDVTIDISWPINETYR
jgi:hypothetical protein